MKDARTALVILGGVLAAYSIGYARGRASVESAPDSLNTAAPLLPAQVLLGDELTADAGDRRPVPAGVFQSFAGPTR